MVGGYQWLGVFSFPSSGKTLDEFSLERVRSYFEIARKGNSIKPLIVTIRTSQGLMIECAATPQSFSTEEGGTGTIALDASLGGITKISITINFNTGAYTVTTA